jgi:hypothetical protein
LARGKFILWSFKYAGEAEFVQAVREVFEDSYGGDVRLRGVVSKVLAKQICLLQTPEVVDLLYEFNRLAADVLLSVNRELGCYHYGHWPP